MPNSTQLVVIGAGPGGYAAAFFAADLGHAGHARRRGEEPRRRLPLPRLHPVEGAAARRRVIDEVGHAADWGVTLRRRRRSTSTSCAPSRTSVVGKLTGGSARSRKLRKVKYLQGRATFRRRRVRSTSNRRTAKTRRSAFESCILATGSRPTRDPGALDRQPARDGLDRRARPARHPEVAARRRRRLHRPRAGHRLRRRSAAR